LVGLASCVVHRLGMVDDCAGETPQMFNGA
jgi:hypothetical protein